MNIIFFQRQEGFYGLPLLFGWSATLISGQLKEVNLFMVYAVVVVVKTL